MADGLNSPIPANTKFETRDMGAAGHRPAHRAPETDAILTSALGADGTDAPALPGGATGVRGWLRYIAETRLGQVVLAAGTAVIGRVGLQVAGSDVSASNPVPVAVRTAGLGSLSAVPAPSANGTPLASSPPADKRGARLYVPPGASVTFTVAGAQPTAAPRTVTVANPSVNTLPANWDEDLAGSQMIYVTASSGSPLFRWY